MVSLRCTPLAFLLTGFAWLLLSSLLGIATLVGLVNGTPLPNWLRAIHVHGTLVGGLLQLIIGGFLVSFDLASEHKKSHSPSRSALFLILNGTTFALLVSLWLSRWMLAGLAGLVLMGIVASLAKTAWRHVGEELNVPVGAGWLYRTALAALLIGLGIGVAMAFRLVPEYSVHARLLHLHLIIMGFFTLTLLVATYQLLPTLLRRELARPPFARFALGFVPIGLAALIAGFVTSSLRMELAVGFFLVVAISMCFFNLINTWIRSGSSGNAASDHLLIGVFFLLLATITGLAMGANYLPSPPLLPIGSLHLVAYTHLAFIGFMVQIICGGLSYAIPLLLASSRVPNPKRRELYREQLETIMNHWRAVQLGAMSFGTMGLVALATLTWSLPLSSPYVHSAVWIAAGLLVGSLALFTAKLAWALGLQPAAHTS
jgi:hypothetical protein